MTSIPRRNATTDTAIKTESVSLVVVELTLAVSVIHQIRKHTTTYKLTI
jgi:hypothetical protein